MNAGGKEKESQELTQHRKITEQINRTENDIKAGCIITYYPIA
jgi:hypothetical protein